MARAVLPDAHPVAHRVDREPLGRAVGNALSASGEVTFGGGMQTQAMGSTVMERNLDRITVVVGLLWFACIVVLGLLMKLDS